MQGTWNSTGRWRAMSVLTVIIINYHDDAVKRVVMPALPHLWASCVAHAAPLESASENSGRAPGSLLPAPLTDSIHGAAAPELGGCRFQGIKQTQVQTLPLPRASWVPQVLTAQGLGEGRVSSPRSPPTLAPSDLSSTHSGPS